MSKYHSKKTIIDGIVFDSKAEAYRYMELKRLEKAGAIQDLRLQVPFELIPTQRATDTIDSRGRKHRGRVIERACVYKADFVYIENGRMVVEDVKGCKTPEYMIKRKLMLWVKGIRIREV